MGTMTITMDMADFRLLVDERDALKQRISELEQTPLEFSLKKLARDVCSQFPHGYTQDQKRELSEAIERGGRPVPN